MRHTLLLRHVLRMAVAEALAASCSMLTAGCGGAIDGSPLAEPPADAAPSDSGHAADSGVVKDASRGDTSSPFDVGPPLDVGPPFDVGPPDTEPIDAQGDDAADADGDDAACGEMMAPPCGSVRLTCLPAGMIVGYNQGAACAPECGSVGAGCQVSAQNGGFDVQCLCGGGRYPAGLTTATPGLGTDPVGLFLAQSAALEASAVRAFRQLARELAMHDAPAPLVRRARRAARQEGVHARLLREAASARGCTVPRMRYNRAPAAPRSVFELATENAIEGCGRETLGTALLALQSKRSTDPTLRCIFARIAADELEHAELAWDLQAWLVSKLDPGARAQVREARSAFLATCTQHVRLPQAAIAALGWPSSRQWAALVAAVESGCEKLAA